MIAWALLFAVGACQPPQGKPHPELAVTGESTAAVKVVDEVAGLGALFADIALPDSARLEAARKLQVSAPEALLADYGRRDNPRIVRMLVEERKAANDEAVLPLLLLLFEGVDGEERIDFEHDILHFGRRAEGRMLELLRGEDRQLVMRAMDALAKMRSPVAGDSIALLLHHPEPWFRISAAHALGEIGADGAAGQLMRALDDTVYSVVNAALVGLGRLRAVETYERIEALTASDNKHVRKHAAIALGELGDQRGVAIVRALASDDPDSGVRFMAGKALQKLEQAP
jgi:hypothetical protein